MGNNLTRGTKKIILNAINDCDGNINRSEILDKVCDVLCQKFSGDSLEYQLGRMGLSNTSAILNSIDNYIFRLKDSAIIIE